MLESSGQHNKQSGIKPPTTDLLFIDDNRDVTPRDYDDLVTGVMRIRDCNHDDAKSYIADVGQEQVERELQAIGTQSTRWGGCK